MRNHARPSPPRYVSVQEDWRAWLPDDKYRAFQAISQELETSYSMLSVSLNEAISLRLDGYLTRCRQASSVLPELGNRLTQLLASVLRALADHARHFGTVPNAAPLDPANFRSSRCQRAARMSAILSRVLLTQRSQYLYKVDELLGLVESVGRDFCAAAAEVVDGTSVEPADLWLHIDSLHYDLNTCLRESVVLLKSFLLVLPEEELPGFEQAAKTPPAAAAQDENKNRLVRNGRAASMGGK